MTQNSCMFRLVVVTILVLVAAFAAPLTSLYQSNGIVCKPFPTDRCVACGPHFYLCSYNEGTGEYDCYISDTGNCLFGNYSSRLPIGDYCSEDVCSFTTAHNYLFQATAGQEVGFFNTDFVGEVATNSTFLSTGVKRGFAAGSFQEGVVFFEDGIFADDSYLTNHGSCTVGLWCTATPGLSYRVIEQASNKTLPAITSSMLQDIVALYVGDDDDVIFFSASDFAELYYSERTVGLKTDSLPYLSAYFTETGVQWSEFHLEQNYGTTNIVWKVTTESDFGFYVDEECDDYLEGGIERVFCDMEFTFGDKIMDPDVEEEPVAFTLF